MSHIYINGWGSGKCVWDGVAPAESMLLGWDELLDDFSLLENAIINSADKVTLTGWSIGGILALQTVNDSKLADKIKRLILISGSARMCSDESTNYNAANSRDIKAMRLQVMKKPQAVVQMFAQNAFAIATIPENKIAAENYVTQSTQFDPQTLRSGLGYLLKTDLRTQLDAIKFSTTIIHARHDLIMPFECAQYLHKNIKNSTLHVIDDYSHCLPVTAKNTLRELIENV